MNSLASERLAPIRGFSQLDLLINPNPDFHPFSRISHDTWFLTRFFLIIQTIIENLALTPFLYTMIEISESLKVSLELFALLMPKLHDVLSDGGSLVYWVKFLQESLDDIIPCCDRAYNQVIQSFLS